MSVFSTSSESFSTRVTLIYTGKRRRASSVPLKAASQAQSWQTSTCTNLMSLWINYDVSWKKANAKHPLVPTTALQSARDDSQLKVKPKPKNFENSSSTFDHFQRWKSMTRITSESSIYATPTTGQSGFVEVNNSLNTSKEPSRIFSKRRSNCD